MNASMSSKGLVPKQCLAERLDGNQCVCGEC